MNTAAVRFYPDCQSCFHLESPTDEACRSCLWDVESKRRPSGWIGNIPTKGPLPKHPKQATKVQVGGTHYLGFAIQPVEFIQKNGLSYLEGCVVKYTVRRKGDKAKRIEDLQKAKHCLDLLIAEAEAAT